MNPQRLSHENDKMQHAASHSISKGHSDNLNIWVNCINSRKTRPGLRRSLCRVKYNSSDDTSTRERLHGSWTFLAETLCRCLRRR